MKVTIAGGYGVFGSRLAELLVRDGHAVTIAGRDRDKAERLAKRLGCAALAVDLRSDPAALFAGEPDAVVDAAGPFQNYGEDPYRLPRLCIDHAADYLDLSDDAAFTAGIAALDGPARDKGRRLISGASSVPGISSAVATDLGAGLDEVLLIETAILPGNRAPRGASVIASIVGQLGTTSRVWRGGAWRDQACWGDARRVRLMPGLSRTARFIEAPDIRLFPSFFKARSVMFRAGMELGVLDAAMRAIGQLRRLRPFDVTPRRAEFLRRAANLLVRFGTDRGGMLVTVVGRTGRNALRREWRLVAEAGDGPYIPAVAARALLRRLESVEPGARPCLAETTRIELEQAMADLSVSTGVEEAPAPSLFQAALAERWHELPPAVQALHDVQDIESFSGTAKVTRGSSPIARFAGWFFGFPQATEAIALTVTKTRRGSGETWERNFGGRAFRSHLTPAPRPHRYRERFWLLTYEQDLPVEDGCMRLPVRRGWLLGVPLPRLLLPTSESREFAVDGVFHFDVALGAPLGGGPIVRYQGSLRPDRREPQPAHGGHDGSAPPVSRGA